MKKYIITTAITLIAGTIYGQTDKNVFNCNIENKEYNLFMRINLYDNNIAVPQHELFGELPGFLGKKHNSFVWAITGAKFKNEHTAELTMINDFGSEDCTAILTCKNDSIYILKQKNGSALKVPDNNKWKKLPTTMEFKRRY